MNRYFLAISVILLSSLSVVLFGGSSAQAASEFDNVVRVTQNLTIKNKDNNLVDLSSQWRNQVVDILTHQCEEENFQNGCTLLDSFQKHVGGTEEGRWGVIANFEPSAEQAYGFTVFWATNADPVCNFAYDNPDYSFLRCSNSTFYQVTVTGQQGWDYYTDSGFGTYRQNGALTSQAISVILTPRNSIYGSNDFFIWYFDVNYPESYNGPTIPQTWNQPDQLYPDYQWSINNGLLGITYMKNLPHFLTGTSYIVVNHMSENWEELGDEVMNDSVIPAGDLVWQGDIVLEPGYYMVRISYDQVFHSPPWPENGNFRVENRWIQFYWDGTNSAQGTTVGCGTDICNDWQDEQSWAEKTLSYLNIPLYGLQAAIIAPLNFIAELPGKQCTPLQLPLPHMGNMQLPCMRSIYEERFGLILNLYQTVIVGLFSYYLAINAISTIKGISSPKDDRIEVVKL